MTAKNQMEYRLAEARDYMKVVEARMQELSEMLEGDVNWNHTGDAAYLAEGLQELARFSESAS